MRLISLKIQKLGPFFEPVEISIDNNVTILTGANDTGKSTVLRSLKLLLTNDSVDETIVNQDHVQRSSSQWTTDTSIQVTGRFRIDRGAEVKANGYQHRVGDTAELTRLVAPSAATASVCHVLSQAHGRQSWAATPLPTVIMAPSLDGLRDIVDLKSPNPLEAALLKVAFGAPFDLAKFQAMGALNYNRAIRSAEDNLNAHLARVMPMESSLRFSLQPIDGKRDALGVLLRDRCDGLTPFGSRGSGVRKMITLFAELVTRGTEYSNRVLLLDEPENSLHPDAQHLLRELLMELGSRSDTQVIYATHSPCMINPMRQNQVRLLRRIKKGDIATSSVELNVSGDNLATVRNSLGISAADSLLFGPVTIVVEGETEILCMPLAIEKLASAKLPGFTDSKKLLSLAYFLNGMGDNFEYLCRIAEAQGTQVILFLDGDKRKVLEQQKIEQKHPRAKIILLDGNEEFEQLVPIETYFKALSDELKVPDASQLQKGWEVWTKKEPKRGKMSFSKQVSHWFEEEYPDLPYRKQAVMRKALELASVEQINAKPFSMLLNAIEQQLKGTSFV